jgi:uncharacterized protein
MSRRMAILAAGLASLALSSLAQGQDPTPARGADGSKHIRSLEEIRNEGVVRQRWDVSCGAAALSTILTYEFKDNTPETSIVVWLLHRLDAKKVRARGGFSLLDLKHFAEARGYNAEGFSDMTMEDLLEQKTPVIVPIHLKGFDHFIVVKGIVAGRVMIADPAFGNNTMRVDRFQELWKGGIVFIVHPPDEKMIPERDLTTETRLVPDATVIARQIEMTIPTFTLY